MTPVEERIDREEARALAQSLHQATWNGAEEPTGPGISDSYRLWVGYGKEVARAYLALLTEHSAREEALREAARLEGALRVALAVYADGSIWGVTRSMSELGHVVWLGEQDAPWAVARAALKEPPCQ